MFKKIASVLLCSVLCFSMLTGCDTQKNYENDCKVFEKTIKSAAKKSDKVDSEKDAKKFVKDMTEMLEEADIKTSEGKEFKKQALAFLEDYGKDLITRDVSEKKAEKIEDAMDDLADTFEEFLDAADDKGADIDDLEEYQEEILDEIK